MNLETATAVTAAAILAIGAPIAVFHHAIALELRHLRAHLFAKRAGAVPTQGKGRRRTRSA